MKKKITDRIERTIGKNGSSGSGTPSRWLITICQNVPLTSTTAPTTAVMAREKIVPFE